MLCNLLPSWSSCILNSLACLQKVVAAHRGHGSSCKHLTRGESFYSATSFMHQTLLGWCIKKATKLTSRALNSLCSKKVITFSFSRFPTHSPMNFLWNKVIVKPMQWWNFGTMEWSMVFERPSSYSMERQWFSMGAYHWPNDPIVKPIVLVVKKEPITIGAICQCKGISYLRDIHWTRWNGNGFQW